MKIIPLQEKYLQEGNLDFQNVVSKFLSIKLGNDKYKNKFTAVQVLIMLYNEKTGKQLDPKNYAIHHFKGAKSENDFDCLGLIKISLHSSKHDELYRKVVEYVLSCLKEDEKPNTAEEFENLLNSNEDLGNKILDYYVKELQNPDNYSSEEDGIIMFKDIIS